MTKDASHLESGDPVVVLRDVGVQFGDTPLFTRASMALRPGEVAVIVGENGSGKSTLLRCIAGLQSHTGDVVLGSRPRVAAKLRRVAALLARATAILPITITFVCVAALVASNVAYNFVDWLRKEGTCDPTDPLVIRCEEGPWRSFADTVGHGLLHDITRAMFGWFYYERFDWGLALQLAVLAGLVAGTVGVVCRVVWLFRQPPSQRMTLLGEATSAASPWLLGGLLLAVVVTALWSVTLGLWVLVVSVVAVAAVAASHEPPSVRLAYIPQRLGLIERATAVENVLHGLISSQRGFSRLRTWLGVWTDAERGEASRALELVGVAHLAERRVESLSGGERRRVTMARALVGSADLLLADEFLSEVDRQTADSLAGAIAELCRERKTAVLFVEHDLELAETHADRGYRMTSSGLVPWPGRDRA